MPKITRKNMKIFGSLAGPDQIGKFGSLAAGAPATTTDIEEIQALANYLQGWFTAVIGGNSPSIEDMNGLCHVFAYQLAYIMQQGVPEWNADTTYYLGSMVNWEGNLYISLANDNLNNALTDTTKWKLKDGFYQTVSTSVTMDDNVDLLRVDTTSGPINIFLPSIVNTVGQHKYIKNIGPNGIVVYGDVLETVLIDGAAYNDEIKEQYQTIHLFNNGTGWDVLSVSGSTLASVVTVTAATYSVPITVETVLCDGTTTNQTITLHTALGYKGKTITIKKIDSGPSVLTIDGFGSETIDDASTISTELPNEAFTLISNGFNWFLI